MAEIELLCRLLLEERTVRELPPESERGRTAPASRVFYLFKRQMPVKPVCGRQ